MNSLTEIYHTMDFIPIVCAVSLASLVCNVFLALKIRQLHQEKAKPPLEITAQQILHDMTVYGTSVVKITPICPTDIFWRSPR